MKVKCEIHNVEFVEAAPDLGGDIVTKYCPICREEARQQHKDKRNPYPLQGTSPSVIPHLRRGDCC